MSEIEELPFTKGMRERMRTVVENVGYIYGVRLLSDPRIRPDIETLSVDDFQEGIREQLVELAPLLGAQSMAPDELYDNLGGVFRVGMLNGMLDTADGGGEEIRRVVNMDL